MRGHPIPTLSRGWFIVFAGILVPVYVIWSRGWRGAALLLGHFIAWHALWFVVAILALIGQVLWFGAR